LNARRSRQPYRRSWNMRRYSQLLVSLSLLGAVVNTPSNPVFLEELQDVCLPACKATYPCGDVWPDKLTVYLWEKCPKVQGMCSLACLSLLSKQRLIYQYDKQGNVERIAIVRTRGTQGLFESRATCYKCCKDEVRRLFSYSSLAALIWNTNLEFVDLYAFLHLSITYPKEILEILRLLPNLPHSEVPYGRLDSSFLINYIKWRIKSREKKEDKRRQKYNKNCKSCDNKTHKI